MKKLIFSLFSVMCSVALLIAQDSPIQKKTESKIIIKKIERSGDEKLTDAQIQILIDSVLSLEGINGDQIQLNDMNTDDVQTIEKDGKKIKIVKRSSCSAGDVKSCTKALKSSTNKAVIGVQLEDAAGNNGATIIEVFNTSGAQEAGLQEGDLLMEINGKKVMGMEDVISQLSSKNPDDEIKVKYMRDGIIAKAKIKLQDPIALNNKCCPESKTCCKNGQKICKPDEMNQIKKMIIMEDENGKKTERIIEGENEIIINSDGKDKEVKIMRKSNEDKVVKMITTDESESLMIEYNTYPNPNQGLLKVNFTGQKDKPTVIQVIDMKGNEVYVEKLDNFDGTYNKEINLTSVKGTLILNIRQGEKIISEKIIVK